MLIPRLSSLSLFIATGSARAHPGHGKPAFLHSHSMAELADWLANGALILFAAFLLGVAGWALVRLGRRFWKS